MMERYLRHDERVLTNVTSPTRDRNIHRNNFSTPQRRDTASSNSSYSSDLSEQSAASCASSNSSVSSAPPWEQHLPPHLHTTNYDLPCEFSFAGCELQFPYLQHEAWMSHTLSHFGDVTPPERTVCLFCDEEFKDIRDPKRNWMDRMIHIGDHRAHTAQLGRPRPDFWLIEHMAINGLVSKEDYRNAITYTEAQYPDDPRNTGFVPLSSKTKQKVMPEFHDLEKEERRRKREARKIKTGCPDTKVHIADHRRL